MRKSLKSGVEGFFEKYAKDNGKPKTKKLLKKLIKIKEAIEYKEYDGDISKDIQEFDENISKSDIKSFEQMSMDQIKKFHDNIGYSMQEIEDSLYEVPKEVSDKAKKLGK